MKLKIDRTPRVFYMLQVSQLFLAKQVDPDNVDLVRENSVLSYFLTGITLLARKRMEEVSLFDDGSTDALANTSIATRSYSRKKGSVLLLEEVQLLEVSDLQRTLRFDRVPVFFAVSAMPTIFRILRDCGGCRNVS
ncbi:unnamed protein product, partial [Mesorhabditis spiculigera]